MNTHPNKVIVVIGTRPEAIKLCPQFGRSKAKGFEIIVRWSLQTLELSSYIPWVRLVQDEIRPRMGSAGGAEH